MKNLFRTIKSSYYLLSYCVHEKWPISSFSESQWSVQDVLAHLKTIDVIVEYWVEYSAPGIAIHICVVVNSLGLSNPTLGWEHTDPRISTQLGRDDGSESLANNDLIVPWCQLNFYEITQRFPSALDLGSQNRLSVLDPHWVIRISIFNTIYVLYL